MVNNALLPFFTGILPVEDWRITVSIDPGTRFYVFHGHWTSLPQGTISRYRIERGNLGTRSYSDFVVTDPTATSARIFSNSDNTRHPPFRIRGELLEADILVAVGPWSEWKQVGD